MRKKKIQILILTIIFQKIQTKEVDIKNGIKFEDCKIPEENLQNPDPLKFPLYNCKEIQFYIELKIEENNFKLLIDTGSKDFWVPIENCIGCKKNVLKLKKKKKEINFENFKTLKYAS